MLAVGQGGVIQVILNTDDKFVFFFQVTGDIGMKGFVAANMGTDLSLIYIDICDLIGSADMQKDSVFLEALREGEMGAIKQVSTRANFNLQA